jgi:DnaJ family protein C protein 30
MNIWRRQATCYSTYFNVSTRGFKLKAPGSRSHYDALGVTPSSTQAEIKSAYYKLSKLYHPDRNKGSDVAAAHFKTINEAYEVSITGMAYCILFFT